MFPDGTKNSIFEKGVSDYFFYSQNMFETSSHLLETKTTNFCEIQFFFRKKIGADQNHKGGGTLCIKIGNAELSPRGALRGTFTANLR